MGWPYSQSPAWSGIRAVADGRAVAVSVEKLNEMLDRIDQLKNELRAKEYELTTARRGWTEDRW